MSSFVNMYVLIRVGSRNEEHESQLGHHPEAGHVTDRGGGASLLPYMPAGVMGSNEWLN